MFRKQFMEMEENELDNITKIGFLEVDDNTIRF
jgi:DNA-directed RNA polymerase subunit K/omega